jgi:hypothetical protein
LVTRNQNIAFVGVTLERVRTNIWRTILDFYERRWALDVRLQGLNTLDMTMHFISGSRLRCYALNQPEPLRNQRITTVYLDESASEVEHSKMMQLASIITPDRPDQPSPKPGFGL